MLTLHKGFSISEWGYQQNVQLTTERKETASTSATWGPLIGHITKAHTIKYWRLWLRKL